VLSRRLRPAQTWPSGERLRWVRRGRRTHPVRAEGLLLGAGGTTRFVGTAWPGPNGRPAGAWYAERRAGRAARGSEQNVWRSRVTGTSVLVVGSMAGRGVTAWSAWCAAGGSSVPPREISVLRKPSRPKRRTTPAPTPGPRALRGGQFGSERLLAYAVAHNADRGRPAHGGSRWPQYTTTWPRRWSASAGR
jgi:hypothetical protein